LGLPHIAPCSTGPSFAAYELVMTDNHDSVIGEITHGANTKAQLKRIACHKGCPVASLIKEWAARAEHPITHQLSGKARKQYYDGE
jgi:hypothetical protein